MFVDWQEHVPALGGTAPVTVLPLQIVCAGPNPGAGVAAAQVSWQSAQVVVNRSLGPYERNSVLKKRDKMWLVDIETYSCELESENTEIKSQVIKRRYNPRGRELVFRDECEGSPQTVWFSQSSCMGCNDGVNECALTLQSCSAPITWSRSSSDRTK
jgi:hypothetical protein